MRTALILTLLCPAAWAQGWQNSDFSFLFGGVRTQGVVVTTPSGSTAGVPGSVAFATQTAFGHQVLSTAAGNLYFELPMTFVFSPSDATIDSAATYFTPGVRFKIPTGTRISFYGAVGGGAALYNERDTLINGQLTATQDMAIGHPVLDVGGGADLRLSRFLSLRAEGRDFIAPAGLGGTAGHNHLVFLAGFAFHL